LTNSFIDVSETPKYDIIWIKNSDVIDQFTTEWTFKELDINHIVVFSPNNVLLSGNRYPNTKIGELSF